MFFRGGRLKNFRVKDNFRLITLDSKKTPLQECIHCKHRSAKNTGKAESHLARCAEYLKLRKQKEKNVDINPMVQQLITVTHRSLSRLKTAIAHRTAVIAVYMINIPV